MKQVKQVLYGYTYNAMNDVYTVRGLESEEFTLEPRYMEYIPRKLVDQIKAEYADRTGVIFEGITPTESFSAERLSAVIDFHGRHFDEEEVGLIMAGHFVPKEYTIHFGKQPITQRVMNRFKPIRNRKK